MGGGGVVMFDNLFGRERGAWLYRVLGEWDA